MFEKRVMGSMYEKAARPEDLPWHVAQPPALLEDAVRAVRSRSARARALDVGCGAGVYASYLAREGLEVTGIDLFPKAIELAKARASADGIAVELVAADLFAWAPERRFDLILDSGCLHSLIDGSVARYAEKIRALLAPRGEYVLAHWGKRHALDWRPVGPRRRTADALAAAFAPELVEIARHEELVTGVPLPFGPTVLGITMRFRARDAC